MRRQIAQLLQLLSRREKRAGLLLFIVMLVGAALEVVGVAAVPAFVGAVVDPERMREIPYAAETLDRLSLDTTAEIVTWGGAALIAIFALKNSFLILNHWLQTIWVRNRRIRLARRLSEAYLRAPYSFHLERNTATLLRNVDRETTVLAYAVLAPALELCTRLAILLAVLGFLAWVEPMITLFWIGFFGVLGGLGVALVSGTLKRYGRYEQEGRSRFLQALKQGLGGIKEARVLNREGYFADQIGDAVSGIARVNGFRQLVGKTISPITEFAAVTGLLALAAWMARSGWSTEEMLVTLSLFVVGLVRMREMMNTAMTHLANLRYNLVSVEPVRADLLLLEGREAGADIAARPRPAALRERIALEHVTHRYEGAERDALRDVSVEIPRGQAVGFVGGTGAGKSTLVDILLGLHEPSEGSVRVDGRDIREIGRRAWRAAVGYVPQEIYLLDDSIRRNVAFGIPDDQVDEVALRRAIRTAQLDRFVERLPKGLETSVGEVGARISGGERQRIGIARALYSDPQVLVFDEATSSLDTLTEAAIIDSVEALKGRRTVIMIAHRLGTVRGCDMLHFLKDGRIEGSGPFERLAASHDEFRRMAAQ